MRRWCISSVIENYERVDEGVSLDIKLPIIYSSQFFFFYKKNSM